MMLKTTVHEADKTPHKVGDAPRLHTGDLLRLIIEGKARLFKVHTVGIIQTRTRWLQHVLVEGLWPDNGLMDLDPTDEEAAD